MTPDDAFPALAACPACAAAPEPAPAAAGRAAEPAALRRFDLALPGIHCAACIDGVETTLAAEPGVAAARVHLGLRRVAVTAEDLPGTEARLIAALARRGFPARSLDPAALDATRIDAEGRDLLARIGVAGFASMNVMLLSIAVWSGAADSTRDLMHWVSAAIALPAVLFSAWPFFASAARSLAARRMDMDVPISTAILMAAAVSLWETILGGRQAFFEAAIMLTFFLLVGRYLAHRTRAAARSAAAEIAALEVRLATRIRPDGGRETVPVDALRPGDLIAVPVGARVPVDGTIVAGRSDVDASMLTGETMPAAVGPGAEVRAGMTNLAGPIEVRADALGEDTLLRRIGRLVEAAERSRTRYATLAFRAARIYGPMVYALAILAFLVWGLGSHDWRLAANVAAAVLIITCPCGLGLAVPAVLTTASGRLYREGVLLKDGAALERLAEIDMVVFDKTGTLTTGRPVLVNAEALSRRDLALAAALAEDSAHPIARAVASAAAAACLDVPRATDVTEQAGLGAAGVVDGAPVRLGRAEWIGAPSGGAHTVAWLRVGDAAPVAFLFADEPRGDAAAAVAAFRAAGLPITLLSGDAPGPVAALAAEVGIADWIAGATPQEKVAHLDALRAEGRRVLMVGDGLNDAAALAAAHVSISPASAVDASRSAADMIVVGSRLSPVAEAWRVAVAARRRIVQNIVFAFAYNVITVPVAFAGLVTPLFAALAMSGSSLAVCLNAFRLGGGRR
ncbi:heavy metal translocating P-type ATPase [Amaricoccus sp.]|uniref:heavy metal translocating P-type ATPase n=1 Tax=Amaricoccus sp. TaxID=1872485 RepID=UPI001B75950B|nr:heavy metal translocating P-type ATPase [Amaricoccus sp.]MBP7002022.1 cadmium-translocating P-type ATPase [Amaricoccus sp.]